MIDGRSKSTREVDKLQERVITIRGWMILFLIGILAVGVGITAWQNVAAIYIIAGIAAWVVFSHHMLFTPIVDELIELNDQLAGRKDEFKQIVQERTKPPVS